MRPALPRMPAARLSLRLAPNPIPIPESIMATRPLATLLTIACTNVKPDGWMYAAGLLTDREIVRLYNAGHLVQRQSGSGKGAESRIQVRA